MLATPLSDHPPLERLQAAELSADDAEHLATCPRCRIDRRLLLETAEGEDPPEPQPRAADDPPLTPSVESLLDSWRTTGSVADGAAALAKGGLLGSGAVVGNYVIDALLGRGGMAVVYRVRHTDLGTPHALKVLTAPGASLRVRLLREGRLQGRLAHPNVVGVTNAVEVAGSPALVLEYVPGPSVERMLRDGGLPLDEADRIGTDVLSGVAAAHELDFVHRDLKPSNVLVDPRGGRAVAKVADFGLAKVLGTDPVDHLETRSGGMLGTLAYMAPEQIRDPRNVDSRSDVFALGALLYELVTGLRCFGGGDMVQIIEQVCSGARKDLPGHVPVRMARAIDAALQVDPADRPTDAAALLDLWTEGREDTPYAWSAARLEELSQMHDVATLPQSTAAREATARSRLGRGIGLAAVLGTAAAVGLGAWTLWAPATGGQVAVMLVHELPGSPGRSGGSSISAIFADDLGGLYTAACIDGSTGCATAVPDVDSWVPLVGPPAMAELQTDAESVALAGFSARPDRGAYRGDVGEYQPGLEPTLAIDGVQVTVPLRSPSVTPLSNDASRPALVASDGTHVIRWVPGGDGQPFVEVRPRGGAPGRLYRLADDGEFTVPAQAIPAAPSQTDVVFGRQASAELDVDGTQATVVVRTQQWMTVVAVDEGRERLESEGNPADSRERDPLPPGRYWTLQDKFVGIQSPGEPWPCFPRAVQGHAKAYSVAVPAGGRRGVRVIQPQGDPLLWATQHPYILPQNCLQAVDREGASEAMILTPPGDDAFVFNIGVVDVGDAGGLLLLDVVDLAPPEAQRVSLDWHTEPDEGVTIRIDAPADVEFRFGLAETLSTNGWYGEDCLHGAPEGIQQCHEITGNMATLRRVTSMDRVRSGETTLYWPAIGEIATVYLEAPNVLRDDGTPHCWTWGHDPAYYAERGCTVVEAARE